MPLLVAGGVTAVIPPAIIHFVNNEVMFGSEAHFWSVVLSSLLACAAGVALSYGGRRRRDARAVLVGTAFTVMASLCSCTGSRAPASSSR